MRIFKVHEAKTHLSWLLERVEKGEEIVIARGRVPVARLVPVTTQPHRPGRLKGEDPGRTRVRQASPRGFARGVPWGA